MCHAFSTPHRNVADSVNNVVILNNFFGRQFNSLNDVSVNPRNGEIYFTDVMYAYLQDFRPAPGLPNQVYRFNLETGLVQVVADGINMPNGRFAIQNGLLFSPLMSCRYHIFPRRKACVCLGHRHFLCKVLLQINGYVD